MKSPQDHQQASREAKTRKPNASVILIHLLLIDNCQQVALFYTSLFTGKWDMLHQDKKYKWYSVMSQQLLWNGQMPFFFYWASQFSFPFFLYAFVFFITGTCKCRRWVGGWRAGQHHHPLPPTSGMKVSTGPETHYQNTRSHWQQLDVT